MKRKRLIFTLVLLLLVSVTAVSAQSSAEVIGVSLPTTDSVFATAFLESAQKTADSLGATLVVMDAKSDLATESANVQALIDQKVNALVLTPVDPVESAPAVKLANDANVPVFLIGASVEGVPLFASAETILTSSDTMSAEATAAAVSVPVNVADVIDSTISDETALAAQTLCDKLTNQGTVLELLSFPAVPAVDATAPESVVLMEARQRSAGFNSALTEKCPDVKVQTLDVVGMDKKAIQDAYLAAIKSAGATGVVGYDDLALMSAVEANVISRQTGVTMLGFDASSALLGAIEAGRLSAAIAPDPTALGESAIKTVDDYLKGMTVARPGVNVPPTVLDSKMLEAVRGGRKLS